MSSLTTRSGQVYTGYNVRLDATAINGLPGLWFDGISSVLTNSGYFPGDQLYNGGTIFFVYRATTNATGYGGQQLFALSGPAGVHPSFFFNPVAQLANFCTAYLNFFNPTNGVSWNANQWAQNMAVGIGAKSQNTHVIAISAQVGKPLNAWMDGQMVVNTAMPEIGNYVCQQLFVQGVVTLGNDMAWPNPGSGWVSDLLFYTNVLTPQQIDRENRALMNLNNFPLPTIAVDGDSVPLGGLAAGLNSPANLLKTALPQANVVVPAMSGRSSTNVVNYTTNWVQSVCFRGPKQAWCWVGNQNDATLNWGSLVTNAITWCGIMHSNGFQCGLIGGWATTMTWPGGSLPVWAQVTGWLQTNALTYADAYIDLSRDQYLGGTNAWTSPAWIPDGMHGTNAAYQRVVNGYWIPAINNLWYGTWAMNSTSCPPPNITQPWTAVDTNAPGVQFVNNNGIWTPQQPASSVLGQLTSLDDYMSIDQQDPYDTGTTILPQINGNYYGVGKLAPAAGSWVFYFHPPRWPMFQWSGFTNQVLWVHVFATNSATVNWTASIRYFTNGLTAGPGSGSGGTSIGSGIYQCGAGTNDYWITVTNKFSFSTMTNVTSACFFWGVNSPSTNVWVIEGTHLHAQ